MSTPRADHSVNAWNAEYIESLYEQWSEDPDSVEPEWRHFFRGFELGLARMTSDGEVDADAPADRPSTTRPPGAPVPPSVAHTKQGRVDSLIYHYRDLGHFAAQLDPLGGERPFPEQLQLDTFGLSDADLEETFDPGHLPLDNPATLRDIIELLEDTYCRTIGVEYMHIQDREQRRWIQKRMETVRSRPPFSHEQKMRILSKLIEADGFESFLDKRYKGKKRFGLDGGEALIPILDQIIEMGPIHGAGEFTIGMAHRGRLNVLVNVLHKTYGQIFTEFEEAWVEDYLEGGGDVKYHRGYSGDHVTQAGHSVRLTVSPNPSHLEFVNPVVIGRARAKQRLRNDAEREQCVPILIHGDAALPGQGVVAETLNFSRLEGYTVGGAVHLVINNQVGFTTDPKDAHSGNYCTDIAKMLNAPIFHVNGDDPEACAFVARLAMEYRQAFKRDIFIDMWCYRKYGHNETDEPTFTQPLLYERIRKHQPVLQQYVNQLVDEGEITRDQFEELYEHLRTQLDEAQTRTKEKPVETSVRAFGSVWAGLSGEYNEEPVDTGVPRERLEQVGSTLGTWPEAFNTHKRLAKLLKKRGEAVANDEKLDWAMGEMLAYGTLLLEKHAVRLTGQDVERGTFSHRHGVIFDQKNGEGYTPLNHITDEPGGQARFCIHNSPLTESACVGFEYGYSLGDPKMLVIWEAQFGDFANGAQVIIDQFIASAEAKWRRFSGLTLFLPHGYEGQGPEHSSARLERFLTLGAQNNMQVVYPTTPAQHFHLLRKQIKQNFRKPLIVMTPKSLLRHPQAVSSVEELVNSSFQRVIDDPHIEDTSAPARLLFCSGKIYYDLVAHREAGASIDAAVVRVEQLYPFPQRDIEAILERYKDVSEVYWVQEEPKNMGAFRFMDATFREVFDLDVHYIGRDAAATPAVASHKMHEQEQKKILITALGLTEEDGEEKDEDKDRKGEGGKDESSDTNASSKLSAQSSHDGKDTDDDASTKKKKSDKRKRSTAAAEADVV